LSIPPRKNDDTRRWQQANLKLTKRIRASSDKLTEIHSMLLEELCDKIEEVDSPFAAKEFVEDAGRLLSNFNFVNTVFTNLGAGYEP